MENLVIIDLSGVLAFQVFNKLRFNCHAQNFLKSIQEKYDVAIWTSTTSKNAKPLVDIYFREIQAPIFEWYREQTDYDPEPGENNYATIKNISKVRKYYNYQKILIVDDTFSKVRFNLEEERLVPKPEKDLKVFYENLEMNIDLKMKALFSK